MEEHTVQEEKRLKLQVAGAALLVTIAYLIPVLFLLENRYGHWYLLSLLAGAIILIMIATRVLIGIGVLLSLLIGIPGGMVLYAVYGYALKGMTLGGHGVTTIGGILAISAAFGYCALMTARRAAIRSEGLERKKTIRIILAGYLAVAVATAAITIYLLIAAKVL